MVQTAPQIGLAPADGTVSTEGETAMEDEAALATPFEAWCGTIGIHPDDPDAWALYTAETPREAS